ncbi:NADP(+)-dependent glutamate dehydrogenase [Wallemia mellicola]|uniref:Glutamate dehydrogenase n=1 Tax=Wallemia mellicola TaxID=1708541 RepID=A0AB74KHH5_9BASI|nr:NADP(+)-dependent glutamate dehydrogenase [Wallemia mellicola]TIC69995.1 NADP(+)-dependent glutamate dehydrogenase [Wallemia mellicola]
MRSIRGKFDPRYIHTIAHTLQAPPAEPEFEQALHEVESTLAPLFEKQPEYKRALRVIQVPERVIQFRVPWENDNGEVEVNVGYRVQFNSALGPYKGGLRLHESVNLSILKFLGFEQIFKNALTGLSDELGGGKGGSTFSSKGRSDNEIRRFCVSFMTELSKHIGQDTDIPAGDIGTTGREVGFMFGQYKRLRNEFSGILTGKGLSWGGSLIRPEATGYGVVYYVVEMLKHFNETVKGKRTLVSGSGNVAQYAALKVIELGGSVHSLSDSKGSVIAADGFTPEDIFEIQDLKAKFGYLADWVKTKGDKYVYHAGARPWTLLEKVDIALPSATQNEVSGEEAKALLKAGCRIVAEGSNMGSTQEAIDVYESTLTSEKPLWYGPGKAANSGGVAVSGLEMAQNSQRLRWTAQDVDQRLEQIMKDCYANCFEVGQKYGSGKGYPSLVTGANIAGFLKVADAMKSHGDWY